jgi:regulator of sigma D
MLTRLERAKSDWGGAHSVIDSWLQERQELLVMYCKLVGLPPFQRNDQALPQKSEIQGFCQLLMDYLSAGHFEVYGSIVSACAEQGPKSLKLAQSLYPKIASSTDIALKFNDNYASTSEVNLLPEFDNDLSSLGQSLEQRFEFEDELIENLHTNHS